MALPARAQINHTVGEVEPELVVTTAEADETRGLVGLDLDRPGKAEAKRDQLAIEAAELLVRRAAVELRLLERPWILWIGDLVPGERDKPLELAPPPLPRRLRDRRVLMVGEEAERPALAVLLAHEEERQLRREEQRRGDDVLVAVPLRADAAFDPPDGFVDVLRAELGARLLVRRGS